MKPRFTRIKGPYSETRFLPRIGKIRLGIKVQKIRTDGKVVTFPRETQYFVVPEEVAEVYGTEPTELDVMFPVDDEEVVFPQKLAWYGSGAGLRCHGNSEEALRRGGDGEWKSISCPCDQLKTEQNPRGECTQVSSLMVLLPKVSMGGCYQINTGSAISTTDVNSAIDFIRAVVGRIALVPLKLRRVPREIVYQGQVRIHYTLSLVLDGNIEVIRQLRNETSIPSLYQIEAPIDESPTGDPTDISHQIEAQIYPGQESAEGGEPPHDGGSTSLPTGQPETNDQAPASSTEEAGPWEDPSDPAPSGSIEAQVVDFQALDVNGQANEIMLLVSRKLMMRERSGYSFKKAKEWAAPFRISFFRDLLQRPDLQPEVTG